MTAQVTGSTGNVPVTAAIGGSLGCIVQGPSNYAVTFGPVTASPTATPLSPPGLNPVIGAPAGTFSTSGYINPSLAAARDAAIASSGLAPALANYLFYTAYLDYLRQGGV